MGRTSGKRVLIAASLALLAVLGSSGNAFALDAPTLNNGGGPAGCNGLFVIQWTAVTGATSYNVLVNYPPYSGYALFKTSTGLETMIHASDTDQLTYVEVEACDSSGCGPVSNQISLYWYSGCP